MSLRFSLTKRSLLYMNEDTVIKVSKLNPYEMNLIHSHNTVFISTTSHNDWYHTMPRWKTPESWQSYLKAIVLLRDKLWPGLPLGRNGAWKQLLLEHLSRIYPSKNLIERIDALSSKPGADRIHGDATFENVVVHDTLVRWIDPCQRPYLPADRLVDVGKMMQSCWNYEGVVHRGEKPKLHESYLKDIAQTCEISIKDIDIAETWLCVHLARLLRYQTKKVRRSFEEVLCDHYLCSL